MPTFDAALAVRITVKARLPNTPSAIPGSWTGPTLTRLAGQMGSGGAQDARWRTRRSDSRDHAAAHQIERRTVYAPKGGERGRPYLYPHAYRGRTTVWLLMTMMAAALATTSAAGSWTPSTSKVSAQIRLAKLGSDLCVRGRRPGLSVDRSSCSDCGEPQVSYPGTDYDRRWLIKTVTFSRADTGGIIISLDEDFEDYRGGGLASRGTHQARFAIDDVTISPETTDDLSDEGEKALGVLFQCAGALACTPSGTENRRSAPEPTSISRTPTSGREFFPPFGR